jgi:hypothetical protein
MGATKRKGNLAEIEVIRHAIQLGHRVSLPYGEDAPYDLVVERNGRLEKVQCKFVQSDGRVIVVRCRSTNGWATKKYSPADVDWIATFDSTTQRCYFVPSSLLGEGKAALHLRLTPARNGQTTRTRHANDFIDW